MGKSNMIVRQQGGHGETTKGISRRRLLAATGVGIGCLPFCNPLLAQITAPRTPQRGGVLRAAFTGKSSSPLDMLTVTQSPLAYVRGRLIWDSLAEIDQSAIRWRIMQSAEPDSTASRWHLKIRKGITFSNGRLLTSRDVLYSLRWLAGNPTTQSSFLQPLDTQASKIDDNYSLTLVLKQPVGSFNLRLATAMFIFPQDNPLIGSGGWLLAQCDKNLCRLQPRTDYWDQTQAPLLDEIQLYGIDDMGARVNGLKAGQFDYIGSVPLIHAVSERNNPAISVRMADKSMWGDLAFIMNTSQPPFNQPEIVEALKLSIDRQAMVKTLTFGMGEVANDLFGAGQIWFNDQLPVPPYDPEKARALLKRAGAETVRQSILTSAYEWGMVESSTLLLRQAKPAGFALSVSKIPVSDYYADMSTLINAPIKSIKFGGSLLPVMLPGFYGSKAAYPFSGQASPQLDQLLQILQRAQGEAIIPAVHNVQEYLYYHGGDAVFARIPSVALSTPRLHGIQPAGSFDYPQLRAAWLEA